MWFLNRREKDTWGRKTGNIFINKYYYCWLHKCTVYQLWLEKNGGGIRIRYVAETCNFHFSIFCIFLGPEHLIIIGVCLNREYWHLIGCYTHSNNINVCLTDMNSWWETWRQCNQPCQNRYPSQVLHYLRTFLFLCHG